MQTGLNCNIGVIIVYTIKLTYYNQTKREQGTQMFGAIKNNWEKAKAALIVENLLRKQLQMGIFVGDPASTAHKIIQDAWDLAPDVLSGKFGVRPQRISVAAWALSNELDLLFKKNPSDPYTMAVGFCLVTIMNEVAANKAFYSLNTADDRLLEEAAIVANDTGERLDEILKSNLDLGVHTK